MTLSRRSTLSAFSGLALASSVALAVACTAASNNDSNGGADSGSDSGVGNDSNGGVDSNGVDGAGVDGSGVDGNQPEVRCTTDPVTGEEVCVCIQLATWGGVGAFGANPGQDGQDAISAWLNENSTGEAQYFATKPVITAESLAPYKVIILQDLSAWPAFSAEEKAVFEAWVRGGGGVISLNGYSANANEMANVNDLLAFTGMSYQPGSDTSNEDQRLAALGDKCFYCYGSSVPQAGWTPHPIGANVNKVGAFHGRVVIPGTAEIVAQENSQILGAAGSYDAGRVFVFHDEWVTYNSQWTGQGLTDDCRDSNNHDAICSQYHPSISYTLPQFWYNSLRWTSNVQCFDIKDPGIVR